MYIDLHCHSNISDGALSPTNLMQMAYENGATMISLTDHDNIDGLYEAQQASKSHNISFINGVEISTTWRGKNIHIVGLNFKISDNFAEVLQKNRSGRVIRLQKIAEKLEKKLKISNIYQDILNLCPNPENVSRTHVAQFLETNNYVKNKNEAFRKWLGDGKQAYVKHEWISLENAVELITSHQGIACIAHPARYKLSATALRNLCEEFISYGGRAIEVSSSTHSMNERLNLALLANRYDLYASAGSDFHGHGEYGRKIGITPDLPQTCKPVWDLFN